MTNEDAWAGFRPEKINELVERLEKEEEPNGED